MAMNIGSAFSGALGGAATGASLGSVIPGVGTAVGAIGGGALGLLGGLFKGDKGLNYKQQLALQKQGQADAWKYTQLGMGLQYDYNEKAAEENQERAMEMWNETNAEAQREHLENAGLSVGLMYGNGGLQRASESSGQQQGVSGMSENPAAVGAQYQAMALQNESIKAQNKKLEAEANLANTEALTKGFELPQKTVDLSLKEMETQIKGQEIELNSDLITKYTAEAQSAIYRMQQDEVNTEITKATKETRIQETIAQLINTKLAGIESMIRGMKGEKEIEKINTEIKYYFYDVLTRRMTAEAAKSQAENIAQGIANNYELGKQGIDVATTKMWGDWISGGIGDIINFVKEFLPQRKIGQALETVDKVVDKWGKNK